jgi:hypothetical protein
MATNSFFNPYPSYITSEQNLVEDLLVECIQITGMDVYYLPRSVRSDNEIDLIYGEDALKEYRSAYTIEMYLENVVGMDGEGDFISKFGLEIRDEISFLVSKRRFNSVIPSMIRPLEGDLIYIPLIQNFFEITFVEHENDQAMFYTLGRGRSGNVYVYALKLKQFTFSNEIIYTGIDEIDSQIRDNYTRSRIYLTSGSGCFINNEVVHQGNTSAVVYSANTVGKYLDVIQVIGTFTSGTITGNTSGASWIANTYSEMPSMEYSFEDVVDNKNIQLESNDILDFTDQNPFGSA